MLTNKLTMKLLFLINISSFIFCVQYAIIYDNTLVDEATTIANLYNSEVNDRFKLNTQIFSSNQIFSNYNLGDDKSIIIKNYINELINIYSDLKYLLILGDETSFPPIYDFQGTPSDDFYTTNNNSISFPNLAIGRIPSSNKQNVSNFTEKLRKFLIDPKIGSWRDKALLIADDEYKPGSSSNPACEIKHTVNSNEIYEILSPYMSIKTLYGIDHESTMSATGLTHNELNQKIINAINSGAALINYIGHGDQESLSAEKILTLDDISQISINDKLGLWVVGTCKFGQYDNSESIAEELILNEGAAIGVISTVRAILETYNSDFLDELFQQYIVHFENNGVYRIGDIIKNAKTETYYDTQNSIEPYQGHQFHLFGDPALPIFSSKKTEYANYFPNDINLIHQYLITNSDHDYGNLKIKFSDSKSGNITYGTPTNSCNGEINYSIPGQIIHENDFYTANTCFSIPLDAISCSNCKLDASLYFQDNYSYNGISHAFNELIINNNINYNDLNDSDGPIITFKYENLSLSDNSIVPIESTLDISIEDISGINSYNGIGHGLRYWFNDELESYIIDSDSIYYTDVCAGIGKTTIKIPSQYTGYNTLQFEAWDNLNNNNIENIKLNIVNKDYSKTIIDNFINFPNPFSNETYFTFQNPEFSNRPINVYIHVFDLNGNLIKTIEEKDILNNFTSIYWDGKDSKNKKIPNGSYVVKIQIESNNGINQEIIKTVSKIH
ncbi:MAG: hypothetical protein CMG00_06805 [Candidatus Marinimicrobia bacterium]|nr:hypothetical protein [Candidatus Neomarinimicrobiota bacterium]